MIAIIPARGGSKGLPRKNIRLLNGKPLIQYTIDAALKAQRVDRVIVTTDDNSIAEFSKNAGAEVPFIRPDYLASDTASAIDVYIHAVDFLKNEGEEISKFMVLLPTTPLRNHHHIDDAVDIFYKSKADTLIAVKEAETPPEWYMNINDSGRVYNSGFGHKGSITSNRQVSDTFYIPNGAIYILDTELLKSKRTYYSNNTIPYIMSARSSIDIDTIDEFEYAEYLISKMHNSNKNINE